VWIAPGLVVMVHFAAWPVGFWTPRNGIGLDGWIWEVPNTPETLYTQIGDQRWFAEYHYRGLHFIGGNLFILTGLGLFTLLVVAAVRIKRQTLPVSEGSRV
jgi:hypothetical protein